MSSKIGLLISLIFFSLFFLLSIDIMCIQFHYSDLDSKSVFVAYDISRTEELNEEAIKQIEDLDNCYNQLSDNDKDALDMAIEALNLIPDNATNGDVIKALLKTTIQDIDCAFIWIDCGEGYCPAKFDIDWWNAPYKRGDSE